MKRNVFIMVAVLWVALGLLYFPTDGQCYRVDFKGRLESNFVLRDTDGFQYGFLDSNKGIQWRNTLKFDLTLTPEYKGMPTYRLEKVFLSYRGAYDAIFALTDRYDMLKDKSPDDFEYGKDDIEWENDMREAFVDLVAEEGNTTVNLRLGRQIIQWGEADGFNLMNVVCPDDNSFQMFFSDIEDQATPLWMARLNYTTTGVGIFDFIGLELLAIPDIRPDQFSCLTDENGDFTSSAPYGFVFDPFMTVTDQLVMGLNQAAGQPIGTNVGAFKLTYEEDVAARKFDNMEYGLSLSFGLEGLQTSLHYFVGHQDEPAVDFTDVNVGFPARYFPYLFIPGTPKPLGPHVVFTHPRQRTLGLSFNYFVERGNFVFRGEGSRTDETTLVYLNNLVTSLAGKVVYQGLLAVDKDLHPKFIGTTSALTCNLQGYWRHVSGLDDGEKSVQTGTRAYAQDLHDSWRATIMLLTDYHHGEISPSIFAMYDPEGTWMTTANIKYTPSNHWQFKLTQMSFWGNENAISPFAGMIGTSELSFKVMYRF